jgi:hypothetical protein
VVVDQVIRLPVRQCHPTEIVREAELDPADFVQPLELGGGQVDGKRAEVVLELPRRPGPDHRDDHGPLLLGADPGDGDLSRRGAAGGGDLVDRVGYPQVPLGQPVAGADARDPGAVGKRPGGPVPPGQQPVAEWRPGGHGQLQRARHRQQVPLDGAFDQAVRHLQPGEPGPAAQVGERHGLRHLPGRSVRYADVKYLPGVDQVIERADDLLHRGELVAAMHPVDVDVVGAQPLEAGMQRLRH